MLRWPASAYPERVLAGIRYATFTLLTTLLLVCTATFPARRWSGKPRRGCALREKGSVRAYVQKGD